VKLAVSNIAWRREDDAEVAEVLREFGVTGVEIAPTAVWETPLTAGDDAWRTYRAWWASQGITVVAMQALLFGRPELALFGSQTSRDAMLEHLTGMMDLGAAVGAVPLVFGSPKNRAVGAMPPDDALDVATAFFRQVGARATARGVCLCIEPNPPQYVCDFATSVAEAIALVRRVDHDGFGLHVDAGAIALNGEPIAETLAMAAPWMRHFHASEPFLEPLGSGSVDHASYAAALRTLAYDGWVSLEMRASTDGLPGLRRALAMLRDCYGA
jgi:D-psicose/D-tagatose/L-ribulose 3-epimerase